MPVDRYDIGVSGEHDAAFGRIAILRGQRREQIRLPPLIVVSKLRADAVAGEIIAHPVDEGEIRFTARRVAGNQRADQIETDELGGNCGGGGRGVHSTMVRRATKEG